MNKEDQLFYLVLGREIESRIDDVLNSLNWGMEEKTVFAKFRFGYMLFSYQNFMTARDVFDDLVQSWDGALGNFSKLLFHTVDDHMEKNLLERSSNTELKRNL